MFKLLVLVFLLHIAHMTLAAKEFYDTENIENVQLLFENFCVQFNKTYGGAEKSKRINIFHENLKKINEMNDKHHHTEFGINLFADVARSEMHRYTGYLADGAPGQGLCQAQGDPSGRNAPAALDWRSQNVVTPVKFQGTCGSCWAFSATAIVESAHARRTGQIVDMSEQQVVDCDDRSGGCQGGWPDLAITKLIEEGGHEAEDYYPYVMSQGACQFDQSKVTVRVAGCATYTLSDEEYLMQVLYENGPISVTLDASHLQSYSGGIFTACTFEANNHAVVLVGYGSENGVDYWIIKNSWSTGWGESGFIRIRRGVNCCGLFNGQFTSATTA